jgi:hypothetical protein
LASRGRSGDLRFVSAAKNEKTNIGSTLEEVDVFQLETLQAVLDRLEDVLTTRYE